MVLLAASMEDRDTKIANYKLKKTIEANLDRLRQFTDDERRREFYQCQLRLSIMSSFEQLGMTAMEMAVHKHKATLTPEQHAANYEASMKPEHQKPLEVTHIGVSNHNKLTRFV